MGEAAKSNVEKRQVGCVIVDITRNEIVAKGHNIEGPKDEYGNNVTNLGTHAEAMALANFQDDGGDYKVYVSHPPCPECAQLLADHGFTDVEVVEAFQKFDGDKLRYDLIDGKFISEVYTYLRNKSTDMPKPTLQNIRSDLWSYQSSPSVDTGEISFLHTAISKVFEQYECFDAFEEALARVLTFGARKYKANNWKKCEDTGRYLAAAHRHLIAKINGEDCDPETGFDHMDHVITNLMFLYVLGYTNE